MSCSHWEENYDCTMLRHSLACWVVGVNTETAWWTSVLSNETYFFIKTSVSKPMYILSFHQFGDWNKPLIAHTQFEHFPDVSILVQDLPHLWPTDYMILGWVRPSPHKTTGLFKTLSFFYDSITRFLSTNFVNDSMSQCHKAGLTWEQSLLAPSFCSL